MAIAAPAYIAHDRFPKQGEHLGARCIVAFNGDLANLIGGEIIRDDMEEPHRTIILLDDDRTVLATECAYTVVTAAEPTILSQDQIEPTRRKLEEAINETIASIPDEDWARYDQRETATTIAQSIVGDDWLFRMHLAHGKRAQVFVVKFKGEVMEVATGKDAAAMADARASALT